MRKRIVSLLIVLMLCTNIAFAENLYPMIDEEEQIFNAPTITEIEPRSDINNAALPVKVTRSADGVNTVIYQGPLGGYDNGSCVGMDFTTSQFAVILEWGSDEVIYIMPLENIRQPATTFSNPAPISMSEELSITSNIKINGVNVGEDSLRIIDNADLTCNFSVDNTNATARTLTILLATYTDTQSLHNVRMFPLEIAGEDSESINFVYRFDGENEHSAKLMFWDSLSGMVPLKASLDFTKTSGVNAYYYNNDNRLLQTDKANGVTISYTYDNMGNLLTKTVSEGGN